MTTLEWKQIRSDDNRMTELLGHRGSLVVGSIVQMGNTFEVERLLPLLAPMELPPLESFETLDKAKENLEQYFWKVLIDTDLREYEAWGDNL